MVHFRIITLPDGLLSLSPLSSLSLYICMLSTRLAAACWGSCCRFLSQLQHCPLHVLLQCLQRSPSCTSMRRFMPYIRNRGVSRTADAHVC